MEEGFRIRWKKPLSKIGKYMGGRKRAMSGQLKQIAYISPDGKKHYADPYTPSEIIIKPKSNIYIEVYNKNRMEIGWYKGDSEKLEYSAELAPKTEGSIAINPKSSGMLVRRHDSVGAKITTWHIGFIPD